MENREKTEMKDRILGKAKELFMRYGIRSITMDEIAAQLGISKKTIYQFFTDKDEMVEAVVASEISGNEAGCEQFQVQAKDAVQEVFIAMEHAEEMMKTMNPQLMYDLEKHHPGAYRKLKQYKYQFLLSKIRENLERGIKENLYRKDLNLDIVCRHRIESAFMVFNQEAFPSNKYPMSQTCQELSLLFLHSVCNSEGKKRIEKYLHERQKTAQHELKTA
jgi:AcrR family transcriptional regulator